MIDVIQLCLPIKEFFSKILNIVCLFKRTIFIETTTEIKLPPRKDEMKRGQEKNIKETEKEKKRKKRTEKKKSKDACKLISQLIYISFLDTLMQEF